MKKPTVPGIDSLTELFLKGSLFLYDGKKSFIVTMTDNSTGSLKKTTFHLNNGDRITIERTER